MLDGLGSIFRAGKSASGIPEQVWDEVLGADSLFAYLDAEEACRLKLLAARCLRRIPIVAGKDMQLDDSMKLAIAAQMALPVLNLGIEHYSDIKEIVVYPNLFLSHWEFTDHAGVVHNRYRVLSGESWQRGPVILSWAHSRPDREPVSFPSNVVIHEFAHKLDQLSGSMNGMPPLHRDMDGPTWTATMTAAYERLRSDWPDSRARSFDPYAATKPTEFFAVCSEYFFIAPQELHDFSPEVYWQLKLYYRQDPLRRLTGKSNDDCLKVNGDTHLIA